jgi:hypothetical protein
MLKAPAPSCRPVWYFLLNAVYRLITSSSSSYASGARDTDAVDDDDVESVEPVDDDELDEYDILLFLFAFPPNARSPSMAYKVKMGNGGWKERYGGDELLQ